MDILIIITISKFSKNKKITQKDPLMFQKIKKSIRRLQIKKFKKTDPLKVDILIIITISKFSKTKKLTHKRPPRVSKNPKNV